MVRGVKHTKERIYCRRDPNRIDAATRCLPDRPFRHMRILVLRCNTRSLKPPACEGATRVMRLSVLPLNAQTMALCNRLSEPCCHAPPIRGGQNEATNSFRTLFNVTCCENCTTVHLASPAKVAEPSDPARAPEHAAAMRSQHSRPEPSARTWNSCFRGA